MVATQLVPVLESALADMEDRRTTSAGIRAMSQRAGEFSSPLQMRLAGAAATPESRRVIHEALTGYWREQELPTEVPDELVIGAGFTAASYCAARVLAGYPRPVVIDQADAAHIGGTFAMSQNPAFYLNSEDRPGLNGYPFAGDALNVIPGALLQPCHVPGREYHDNSVLGWLIRLTLAQYARVVPGIKAVTWSAGAYPRVTLDDAAFMAFGARRIIDARGFGEPAAKGDGERILTFPQLMAQADTPWPCRGMTRVAVIGGGKSALCAAEMILRLGPQAGLRTAALDGAPAVDLYGAGLPQTNLSWATSADGRYRRLGSHLPSEDQPRAYHDLTIYNDRAEAYRAGDEVLVAGRQYSHAVLCTGWRRPMLGEDFTATNVSPSSTILGRQYGPGLYAAGVAADIPWQDTEYALEIPVKPENQVAMWRLGGRTAQLAAHLGPVSGK